jgi:hypothetical protein
MRQLKQNWRIRGLWLIVAAIAVTQTGCLAAAAGTAAGGAVGYAYWQGRVGRDYVANRDDVWSALHTSLNELQMPVVKERRESDEDQIESKTADGDMVKIYVSVKKSQIPAEGDISRVSVRVATFGDTVVSSRLLDQVDRHLVPAAPPQTPPPPTALGQPQPVNGAPPLPVPVGPPPQTPPPPLAIGHDANR